MRPKNYSFTKKVNNHQSEVVKKKPRTISVEDTAEKVFSSDNYHSNVINWLNAEVADCIKNDDFQFIRPIAAIKPSGTERRWIILSHSIRDAGTLKLIDAEFESLHLVKDVLVKLPPDSDLCLKLIMPHFCVRPVDSDLDINPEIVFIPQHWRRSLTFGNTKLYRNFYTQDENFLGRSATADVTIQIKTNLSTGEKNIVLNYANFRPTSINARRSMKIGKDGGQIAIPGTDKFILVDFLKRSPRKKESLSTVELED